MRLWKAPEKSSALSVVRALSAQGNQPKRHPISTLVCEDFCGWVPGTAFQPGTMYFPEPRGGIWDSPMCIRKSLTDHQSGPFVVLGCKWRLSGGPDWHSGTPGSGHTAQPEHRMKALSQPSPGVARPSLFATGHLKGPDTYPSG